MWLKEVFICSINILLKSGSAKRVKPLTLTVENSVEFKQGRLFHWGQRFIEKGEL
jgi:hypothetical protein